MTMVTNNNSGSNYYSEIFELDVVWQSNKLVIKSYSIEHMQMQYYTQNHVFVNL